MGIIVNTISDHSLINKFNPSLIKQKVQDQCYITDRLSKNI